MNGITHKQAIQLIHRKLDGLLNESQLEELDEHLRSCDSCRAYAGDMDGLSAHVQNEFHRRWDDGSGPSQNVMEHVTTKARRIPMTNRISSGAKLFVGALALIVLAVAINFVVSQLQSTSPVTNPTETVDSAALSSDRLIAFTSEQNGNVDIYTMHADGSELMNITNDPAYDGAPFWSPDGKQIAFISDRNGSTQIYLMDADGSNVSQVTSGVGNYAFDLNGYTPWSPDGRKLIFSHKLPDEQSYRLYFIDIADKTITTLTNEPGSYIYPSWSPDGKYIAFAADTGRTPRDLFIVGSDGNHLTKLTENLPAGEFFLFDYEWSQDGTSLFFITDGNQQTSMGTTYVSTVYEANVDGSVAVATRATDKQILDWENGIIVQLGETNLSWLRSDGLESTLDPCLNKGERLGVAYKRSYSGNLVFGSNCSESGWTLYWANSDGTITNQLLNSPISDEKDNLFYLAWSPDDQYLAFVSLDTGSPNITETLYVLDVAKAREDPSVQPLNLANSLNPSWQPVIDEKLAEEASTPQPRTTPKDLLAFASNQNGNFDIYTIQADGSRFTNLTNNPAMDINPFWSPDGGRIAFESGRDGFGQIYLMDGDGSNVVQLTKDEADHQFVNFVNDFSPWSSDGSKLIFSETLRGEDNWKLFVIDANGENKTPLVDEPNIYSAISWSPDGQHIALQADDPRNLGGTRLYVVNADGSDLREVTGSLGPNQQLSSSDYHWSADGQSIFFVTFFQKPDPYWTAYEFNLIDNSLIEQATTDTPMYGWWDGISLTTDFSGTSPFIWERPDGTNSTLKPHEKCQQPNASESGSYIQRSSNGNWIIGGYCPDGGTWFYWVNADGTVIKPLLNSPVYTVNNTHSPISWSRDDKFIAFTVSSTGESELYILNVAEALNDPSIQPVKLSKSFSASWQPVSGNKLAEESSTAEAPPNFLYTDLITFTADSNAATNGNMDVYIARMDGSQLTNLTHDPTKDFNGNDYDSQWSPDKKKIAFISHRGGVNTGDTDIYTMDPDGSNLTRLTDKPGYDVMNAWSPDGRQIVYFSSSGYDPDVEGQLIVMNADGSDKTVITKELGFYYFLNWSPDGQKIIYAKQTLEGESVIDHGVYIVDANGENEHELNVNNMTDIRWEDPEHFVGVVWPEHAEQSKLYRFSTDGRNPLELASHEAPIVAIFEKTYVVAYKDSLDWFTIGDNSTSLSSQSLAGVCEPSENRYLQTGHTLSPDQKHAFVVLWCKDTARFYLENEDGSEFIELGTIEGSSGLKPEWSLNGNVISVLTFDHYNYVYTDLYLFDLQKMLADPSAQPIKTNLGVRVMGPTIVVWPPEPNNSNMEATPTPEPTQTTGSGRRLQMGTGIGNGEWVAFIGGNVVLDPVEPTAVTVHQDVYKIHPDGSGLTNLTGFPASYYGLQWSPDGEHLLFVRENHVLDKINIMRHYASLATGYGEVTPLISDPDHYGYSWSPNSDKIVFADSSGGNYDIYTVYGDGRNDPKLTQLTDNPAQDVGFAWSPDSSQIAFQRLDGNKLSIFIMNEDGSDQREVAHGTGQVKLQWSYDGTSLYASSTENDWLECEGCVAKPGIYQIKFVGPSVHQIYYESDADQIVGWFLYDTPQNTLYFMRINRPNFVEFWGTWFRSDGNSVTEIGALNPQQTCKTTTGNILNESISPNPRFSVISNFCAGGFDLYLADRETTPEKRFTHLLRLPLDTQGQGGDFATLPMGWSPDGRWLIYDNGLGTIYLLDIEKAIQDPDAALTPLLEPVLYTGTDGQSYQSSETISLFGLEWQPVP